MYRLLIGILTVLCIVSCDPKALEWSRIEESITDKAEETGKDVLRGDDDGVSIWGIPENIEEFLGEFFEISISDDGESLELSGNHGTKNIDTAAAGDLNDKLTENPFFIEYTRKDNAIISISIIFSSGKRIECIRFRSC